MNPWLDTTVKAYLHHYGTTQYPVVWEVGSRDGRDGVELAERIYKGDKGWFWDRAKVVCMEPNPEQAKIIKENYSEVNVMPIAASNVKGQAPFVIYHGDEGAVGSSSLNLNWKGQDFGDNKHEIIVKTDRLDNLIGKEEIDIMKIDVEGHSFEVLEGLGDKIFKVRVFHIETEEWTNSCFKVKALMMARSFTLIDEAQQYSGMPDQVWVRG